jgi:ElaB/YqjD/DUF883 family membrane-anchored ribosome-binding protein
VADVEFPLVLGGYDRLAVDAYVRKTSQLVAELQATRSPEAAVRRALERVGDEVSGILQRAHDTAEQITAKSRAEAEDRLELAREEAAQITAAAEQRVKDLDAETDRIWAERHRIVEDARELARQLLGLAESAAERFPAEDAPADGPVPEVLGGAPATADVAAPLTDDLPPPELDEDELDDDATAVTTALPLPVAGDEPGDEPETRVADPGAQGEPGVAPPPGAEPEPPAPEPRAE